MKNLWNQIQTQKVLISSEAMGHLMRMFDTDLERLKVILLVFESHMNIPVMLVIFAQHPLTSLLTKIGINMSTTNTFDHAYFFGMSSYDQYFLRIQKYGSSAFKRQFCSNSVFNMTPPK